MARPQVRDVSAPERIQAVASPVSTYVRPADPGRSSLHDLAEGLAAFDQGLGGFLDRRKQETEQADKARAITDFHRNNQKAYGDAVREGLIPPTASKSYIEWYKKQQGHLAGLKLTDKFSIDYQQWEGRDSADPEAFGKFVSGWMTQNVGQEQDPSILEGLAPHLDNLASTGYQTFNQDRASALKSKAQATSGAIVTDTLIRTHEAGRVEGSVDYDDLWSGLMTQREEAVSKGERGEDFDSLMVDSIILQAEETGDADMLKLLDRVPPGQELSMARNPEVREKRLRALDRIDNRLASRATDEAQLREKQEKRQHEDGLAMAVLALSNGEEVPEELIQQLSRRDGEIRYKLAKYRKEYGDLETSEDPEALMQVYQEIDSGAGKAFILDMREKGVIRDPATFIKAMDRAEAVRKATEDGGVFTSPTYKDTVKFITNATGYGEISELDGLKGISDETLEALYDYRNMLLKWDQENPDSGLLEKERAARDIGEIIRSRIPAPEAGGNGEYISEADAAAAEADPVIDPVDIPTEEPAQPVEEDGGYLPQTLQNLWDWATGDDEEAPQESSIPAAPFDGLSDSTKQSIEAFAKKKGLSVEEAYGVISGRAQKLAPEGVDPTVTNSISPDTQAKLTTLLQDPPKVAKLTASNVPVAPLLSLIGNTEGTDKGDGYNETLGYGAYTGGDVDLVNMTLGDIDKLQTDMLRHPNNKWNSSAIGRYQIIRTTLRGLKEEMGLTDDMAFTPELQDQMAMHLLERRGLSKWQAGQMTDDEFINGLSAEWASLPKSDGKGTYQGQRVGTSTQGMRGVLDQIRGTEVASLDPSIGLPSGDPYANIPDVDDGGNAGQRQKFLEWNPDPVGNHEANLQSIDPQLGDVVRRAQEISGVKFVIGSGKRDEALQKKAVEWGWSKTEDSDHLDGGAVDLWPLDENGAVKFDPAMKQEIVMAMKLAAKELGVALDIGAEWKKWKDKPHFALRKK